MLCDFLEKPLVRHCGGPGRAHRIHRGTGVCCTVRTFRDPDEPSRRVVQFCHIDERKVVGVRRQCAQLMGVD